MRRFLGTSLTELLVALLITAVLMSGMMRLYSSSKSQFNTTYGKLKDYQEWLWLSRQIRLLSKRAGYCGLYPWSKLTMSPKTEKAIIPAIEIIKSNSSILPATVARQVLPGTDVLRFVMTASDRVFTKGDSGIYSIELLKSVSVSSKKSYLICDRRHIELLRTSETKKTSVLHLDSPLRFQFREGAVVAMLQVVYLYVRKLDKETALYLYVEQGHRGELTRRVSSMSGVLQRLSHRSLLAITLNWHELPLTIQAEV